MVIKDTSVLNGLAPVRQFHDSGVGYKCSNLLITYLLTYCFAKFLFCFTR